MEKTKIIILIIFILYLISSFLILRSSLTIRDIKKEVDGIIVLQDNLSFKQGLEAGSMGSGQANVVVITETEHKDLLGG